MNSVIKLLRQINWPIILIALLVGVPFLVIGLSEVYKTTQMINAFASARGTVVDNVWRAFAEGGAAYTPVIEFQTADGQTIRFTDGIGTYPPEYEAGAQVNVLYDPQDVHHARVNSWKRIWFGPTLITAIGVLPILVGIGLAWLLRSKNDL